MKPDPIYSNFHKAMPDMTDAIDQEFIAQARGEEENLGHTINMDGHNRLAATDCHDQEAAEHTERNHA